MPAPEPWEETDTGTQLPTRQPDPDPVDERGFRERFGEAVGDVLDIRSWRTGRDLTQEYPRIQEEVRQAVACQTEHEHWVRAEVLPKLTYRAGAPPCAGVFEASRDALDLIHRGLLLNGGVEACDGTVKVHDTLPLTIYQVGVSLVSYQGDQGTWHQRLFHRDLRRQSGDRTEEFWQALEQRAQRSALNHDSGSDQFGALARKTVMDYAERAILLHKSGAVWRMGHGNPITYELLTGGGLLELMEAGTNVVRDLIERHQKFVFVASEPRELVLLSIGQALLPGHYAIVQTLEEQISGWFHQYRFKADAERELSWDGELIPPATWIPRFLRRVASQVVVGVYRASPVAPAQLFYAHVDHAHAAAHVAMADSLFEEHRGFPLLIRLADHVCTAVFGGSLDYLTQTAYASAGVPWRYTTERTTRDP
jgi:hypothetical protein